MLVKCNKPIINNFCREILVSVAHAHKGNGISVEYWYHINVIIRRLINQSLILVAEVNQSLATNLDRLQVVTHEIILCSSFFVHKSLIKVIFFSTFALV